MVATTVRWILTVDSKDLSMGPAASTHSSEPTARNNAPQQMARRSFSNECGIHTTGNGLECFRILGIEQQQMPVVKARDGWSDS